MSVKNNKIKSILVANRSEIAYRIIATCKSLGIKTIAIYSDEDKFNPYVYFADQAYSLENSGISAYLNQKKILDIALTANVDAIHPGYGFLSENYIFAQKVIAKKLIWIGPTPQNIKKMGNKIVSRKTMEKSKIPVIPGYFIKNNDYQSAKKYANKIGFPIIAKDPLAGGGKAMRIIKSENEIENAINRIKTESKKYTGANEILLEKYIKNGRHIEVQVAGDGKNFIHLYERECSIQRRQQKIIEEAPCNFIEKKTIKKMYDTAIKAAKTINYENIGTIEFIVTNDNKFYFLEMNTRLQVEHSITEVTTGIDLVALQIQIAENKHLSLTQKEIAQTNHALECRIYCEDPKNNFLPSAGKIKNLQLPNGPFIRNDHSLEENLEITPLFDPMLSKITTWGKNRNAAINNMMFALNQFNFSGIKNNICFLKQLLTTKEFLTGKIHTQFLNKKNILEKFNSKKNEDNDANNLAIIATAVFEQIKNKSNLNIKNHKHKNWKLNNWKKVNKINP